MIEDTTLPHTTGQPQGVGIRAIVRPRRIPRSDTTMKNQNDDILVTRTQEWELEWPILINFNADDECVIECGGAQMPRYKVTGESLPDVIRELVKKVTRDAIADEAREWSNV